MVTLTASNLDVDAACGFLHLSEQGLDQGGLSGADRADDGLQAALLDAHVDVLQERRRLGVPRERAVLDHHRVTWVTGQVTGVRRVHRSGQWGQLR